MCILFFAAHAVPGIRPHAVSPAPLPESSFAAAVPGPGSHHPLAPTGAARVPSRAGARRRARRGAPRAHARRPLSSTEVGVPRYQPLKIWVPGTSVVPRARASPPPSLFALGSRLSAPLPPPLPSLLPVDMLLVVVTIGPAGTSMSQDLEDSHRWTGRAPRIQNAGVKRPATRHHRSLVPTAIVPASSRS